MAETIPEVLAEAALAEPGRPALRYRTIEWTYERLDAAADGVARTLIARGVAPGERVGYWGPKRPEAMAAFYGVLRAGAVWVPIDTSAPMAWAAAVTSDCRLAALVTTHDRAAGLSEMPIERPPRLYVLMPEGGHTEVGDDSSIPWDDVVAPGPSPKVDVAAKGSDLAAIFYTSGSTGAPKGVMHHHRSLLTSARWFAELVPMVPDDRMPVFPPLNFKMSTYGLISTVLARATAILVSLEAGFRGSDLAALIRGERVTIWRSVGHVMQVLASAAPEPGAFSSLRCVMVGGGPLRPDDVRVVRAAAPQASFWHTYGSTESGTICAGPIDADLPQGERIPVGRPVDHAVAVHLRDDGSVAGPGEEGEMVVWSPKVMIGYWDDPDATAAVLIADPTGGDPDRRWFRTRDLVRLRSDGRYDFIGRLDDMVKSRGYRVELGQVEDALASHPAVRECAVAAVPHPGWGSAIVAFAAVADGTVSDAELRRHVAERLPLYMVPQRIHFLAKLPRTGSGKVDRPRLLRLIENSASGA